MGGLKKVTISLHQPGILNPQTMEEVKNIACEFLQKILEDMRDCKL